DRHGRRGRASRRRGGGERRMGGDAPGRGPDGRILPRWAAVEVVNAHAVHGPAEGYSHCFSCPGEVLRTLPPKALPPRKYHSNDSSTFVAFVDVTDAATFGVMGPRNHRPAPVRYSYSIK